MLPFTLARAPQTISLLVLAVSLLATTASAQGSDDERARAHFMAGRSYMEQARYDDAAEQFQEAYRLSQRPEMLMNASTAYERALRFDEAISSLDQYLAVLPETAERATLEERLVRLRELRDRSAAASPQVPADPQPAQAEAEVDLTVEPTPPSAGGALGDLSVVGIALGGVGVVALVVSLATGIVAHDTHQNLRSRCGADGLCPPGSQGEIDSGSALALTSTITTFGGIALLGAGVALFAIDLTSGPSSERDERAQFRIGPGPGLAGIALEGSF